MPNILVATPSYKNTVSAAYLRSLLEYSREPGIDSFTCTIKPGDSLVTRARNAIFTQYVQTRAEQGYTHLFWQDDDIYVEGAGLAKIANSGLDVVGIAYPLKTYVDDWGINCCVAGVYEEAEPRLYRTMLTGTGALLLSNTAVDALVDYCRMQEREFFDGGNPMFDVFHVGVYRGVYYSEDWFLCRVLRELGFTVYVDSSSLCTHHDGTITYRRPALDIDPRAIARTDTNPLDPELRQTLWTPNDFHAAFDEYGY